jgi:hypothetical protein
MQMTTRDADMLEWLSVVRVADVDAVRWALAGLAGSTVPVTPRRANMWIARLVEVGLLGRARPNFRDGSVIWATHQAIGKPTPNLYRQTARHEVAVAAVSARYLAHGYTWSRDRIAPSKGEHQADGVAVRGDEIELVEVELTPKTLHRYPQIFRNHAARMDREGVTRVVYFGTPEVCRVVSREADTYLFHALRPRLLTMPVIDVRGTWDGPDYGLWGSGQSAGADDFTGGVVSSELDGFHRLEPMMEGSRA